MNSAFQSLIRPPMLIPCSPIMPASESSLNTPSSGFCHTLPMLVDCMQREFFVHLLNSFLAFQIIPDFKTVGFCGWSLYPASPVAVVTRFTPLDYQQLLNDHICLVSSLQHFYSRDSNNSSSTPCWPLSNHQSLLLSIKSSGELQSIPTFSHTSLSMFGC